MKLICPPRHIFQYNMVKPGEDNDNKSFHSKTGRMRRIKQSLVHGNLNSLTPALED